MGQDCWFPSALYADKPDEPKKPDPLALADVLAALVLDGVEVGPFALATDAVWEHFRRIAGAANAYRAARRRET